MRGLRFCFVCNCSSSHLRRFKYSFDEYEDEYDDSFDAIGAYGVNDYNLGELNSSMIGAYYPTL